MSNAHVRVLMRMIRRANDIASNPHTRTGLALEESILYREMVERNLSRLQPAVRAVVRLVAEGHSMADAAYQTGIPMRTLHRTLADFEIRT